MTFGEQVQDARKRAGMTQEQLGDAVGLTQGKISLIESGHLGRSVDKALARATTFATALGVERGELLG